VAESEDQVIYLVRDGKIAWSYPNPVWAKYSCGTPVVPKQSAEPFSAPDRASTPTMSVIVGGKQQSVALALVIPLRMKVLHELDQRVSMANYKNAFNRVF
jgi:hypothetical protein